uniref:Uncharacterized protein n=1 Tax=Anguilla anguilla TaxID=7936 RepID=A0A0E9VV22_ANGAN
MLANAHSIHLDKIPCAEI